VGGSGGRRGVGRTAGDGLASVLAGLLEPLGGSVFVVAAVLGEVAGHLVRLLGADVLDVGRVLACVDSSEKACWRRGGSNARSDSEDSEKSGGLCEHDVEIVVVSWEKWWVLEGSGWGFVVEEKE